MTKILFFGSCDFSVLHLKALLHRYSSRIEVVTPRGRCQLQDLARSKGLRVHYPTILSRGVTVTTLDDEFDFGVVVSFGHMLSQNILQQFRRGSLNVHPSLLPLYRGASPIQHQIMDGVETGGVSVINLDPNRFDTGRIFAQSLVDIKGLDYQRAMVRFASQGAVDLLDVLDDYDGFRSKSTVQNDSMATRAPKVGKQYAQVSIGMSAQQLYLRHMAIGHQHVLQIIVMGRVLSFGNVTSPKTSQREAELLGFKQGRTFEYSKLTNKLYIQCKDQWLAVDHLSLDQVNVSPKTVWQVLQQQDNLISKSAVI